MVFLVVEGVITSLASVWFVEGSLAVLVVQVCGGDLYPQLVVFMTVSFMLFLMVRPSAYKHLYGKRAEANVDSLIGHKAMVKDRVDNAAGTGTTILADETWLAGAAEEGGALEAGDVVVISAISGAELLAAMAKQEREVEEV